MNLEYLSQWQGCHAGASNCSAMMGKLGTGFMGIGTGFVMAIVIANMILAFLLGIALYIYVAIALSTIAKKTGTKNKWMAWLPIFDVYLVTQIAKVNGLWTLAIFLPIIPFIGSLALLAAMAWIFWKVAERRHLPGWVGLLMIISPINLIILGVLAWYKKK